MFIELFYDYKNFFTILKGAPIYNKINTIKKRNIKFYSTFFDTQIFTIFLQSASKNSLILFDNLINEYKDNKSNFNDILIERLYDLYQITEIFLFPKIDFKLKPNNTSNIITEYIFDISSLTMPETINYYYFDQKELKTKSINRCTSNVAEKWKYFDTKEKISTAKARSSLTDIERDNKDI